MASKTKSHVAQSAPVLFTVPEVAQILKVSVRTVRRLIAQGKLRIIRIGGSVRVTAAALAELMEEAAK